MATSGPVIGEPGGGSDPTRFSKLRRPGIYTGALLAVLALTACGNNVKAQPDQNPYPDQPRTSASAPQVPGGEKGDNDNTNVDHPEYYEGDDEQDPDTQPQGEFESIPSGLTVDYKAFESWDRSTGPSPNDLRRDEEMRDGAEKRGEDRYTQREKSDEFFNTNGIKYHSRRWGEFGAGINVFGSNDDKDRVELVNSDPERFVQMLLDKERRVMALNQDDTDPRNREVAKNLVEAITIEDSPARDELRQRMEEARQGIISPEEAVMTEIEVLQHSKQVTSDKKYIIEFMTTRYGKQVKVTMLFEKSDSGDLRSARIGYTYEGQEEQTVINTLREGGMMVKVEK